MRKVTVLFSYLQEFSGIFKGKKVKSKDFAIPNTI